MKKNVSKLNAKKNRMKTFLTRMQLCIVVEGRDRSTEQLSGRTR